MDTPKQTAPTNKKEAIIKRLCKQCCFLRDVKTIDPDGICSKCKGEDPEPDKAKHGFPELYPNPKF
jgi:hypothetical protein